MSDEIHTYTTLAGYGEAEYEEKGSVFIGAATHVSSEEEAMEFIKGRKKAYMDATHNVWAYSLNHAIQCRYSDDGEPQGTSGMPTLDGIRKAGVDDAVVVITRYFGGTLLGAGGLVRAYSHSCKLALEAARIVTYEEYAILELNCSYSDYQKYLAEFPKYGIVVDETEFGVNVQVKMAIKMPVLNSFCARVREMSGGRTEPKQIGTRFDYR